MMTVSITEFIAARLDKDEAVEQPCPTLCALAAPYSDHPDYNPEWSIT